MKSLLIGPVLAVALLAGACAPVASPNEASIPSPAVTAAFESDPPPPLATAAQDLIPFPTSPSYAAGAPDAETVADWRPPPYPVPWALRPEDHFYFSRPIPSGEINWPNPIHRYGSTYFGAESTHTGVDIGAELGTPVLASAAGEVVWTGFGLYRGVEDLDDPYGLAIALRHDFGHEGKELYTVYTHLATSLVWRGQRVEAGEVIGSVGDTGHTTGPHLHFEVRLGENYYFATRNPELWMVPPEGWGVLSGRVADTYNRRLPEHSIRVTSVDSGRVWEVRSYANDTVVSDSVYNENFVLGDLPAGPYRIDIEFQLRTQTAWMFVLPGQTNFLVFQGDRGFRIEPTPTPASRVLH